MSDAPSVTEVERSAAAGDAGAWQQLAVWRMVGDRLPRDLPYARRLLRRAVEIGHVDAALMEVALTASGAGAPPDWEAAERLLREAAETDPVANEHLALLDAMQLRPGGAPGPIGEAALIGEAPRVWRIARFLSPAECAHIAGAAADLLAPSEVVDPGTGRLIRDPVRTSDAAVIGPTRETLPIQAILRRIAAATGTEVDHGEPLALLRYTPGQQYRPHMDTLPPPASQRVKTALLYLNEGYGGGQTRFEASGLTVTGRGGDLIWFDNVDAAGRPNRASRHSGLPVTAGAKWLATRWIRAAPLDPWAGQP